MKKRKASGQASKNPACVGQLLVEYSIGQKEGKHHSGEKKNREAKKGSGAKTAEENDRRVSVDQEPGGTGAPR